MKYVITDEDEARVGDGFHSDLAIGLKGKVVRAGHCRITEDFGHHVWGESIGYNIKSQPGDAVILDRLLPYNPPQA